MLSLISTQLANRAISYEGVYESEVVRWHLNVGQYFDLFCLLKCGVDNVSTAGFGVDPNDHEIRDGKKTGSNSPIPDVLERTGAVFRDGEWQGMSFRSRSNIAFLFRSSPAIVVWPSQHNGKNSQALFVEERAGSDCRARRRHQVIGWGMGGSRFARRGT